MNELIKKKKNLIVGDRGNSCMTLGIAVLQQFAWEYVSDMRMTLYNDDGMSIVLSVFWEWIGSVATLCDV